MKTVQLTLLTKPGCHLCDDARAVVDVVRADVAGRGITVEFSEVNILEDPALTSQHFEDIPVVQVNGRRHSIWHVNAAKLTAAIEKAAKPGIFGR